MECVSQWLTCTLRYQFYALIAYTCNGWENFFLSISLLIKFYCIFCHVCARACEFQREFHARDSKVELGIINLKKKKLLNIKTVFKIDVYCLKGGVRESSAFKLQ